MSATAATRFPENGAPFPEVTVLLGDPSLPDPTKRDRQFHEEDLDCVRRLQDALRSLPGYRFTFIDRHQDLLSDLIRRPPAFVLNFCDTGFRNQPFQELNLPALLEMLGVPYSGAGPFGMVMAFDKAVVRMIAAALEVPVPRETYIEPDEVASALPAFLPALIKPVRADGSVGITKDAVVRTTGEARDYLDMLGDTLPGRALLIQEYLPGPEYGLGVIGNPDSGLRVLPPLEVDFSGLPAGLSPILSFESKADPASPYWTEIKFREAVLDGASREKLAGLCRRLFARLGCRDYARFDFRTDDRGELKLLEVNPNPAWSYDGKLAVMAGFAGFSYADMLSLVLEAAQRRAAGEAGLL